MSWYCKIIHCLSVVIWQNFGYFIRGVTYGIQKRVHVVKSMLSSTFSFISLLINYVNIRRYIIRGAGSVVKKHNWIHNSVFSASHKFIIILTPYSAVVNTCSIYLNVKELRFAHDVYCIRGSYDSQNSFRLFLYKALTGWSVCLRRTPCGLWGRNWIFKYYVGEFYLSSRRRLIHTVVERVLWNTFTGKSHGSRPCHVLRIR
jgi:hypothetical protein